MTDSKYCYKIVILLFVAAVFSLPCFADNLQQPAVHTNGDSASKAQSIEAGLTGLILLDSKGGYLRDCPIKHTSVSAQISGFVAHVTVTQTFMNNARTNSDAVYSFPLSDTAAVSQMEMKIGHRTIQGSIKRREEAKQIFEHARRLHQTAALLEEERPNIFTQQVANLRPAVPISISLKYTEMLPFASGSYTFTVPTSIGPRFCPGTDQSNDTPNKNFHASLFEKTNFRQHQRIERLLESNTDFDIKVQINGGMPISRIRSALHRISIPKLNSDSATIELKNDPTLRDRDFVLKWDVSAKHVSSGCVAHQTGDTGYFTLMLMPTKNMRSVDAAPKELIFIVDCSGSQAGQPIEQAKTTLRYILNHMNPQDTFQILAFNNQTNFLFSKPEPASANMRERAKSFISSLSADGGTFMAPAVESVCAIPADRNRLRVVTIMTDRYIGDDYEILGLVRKLRGTSRWFSFGTGDSVNRFLIDGIAKEGGGESEYVLSTSSEQQIAEKFFKKISSPILTDVRVDFGKLPVKDCFPSVLSDIWEQRTLYISGQYTKPMYGPIKIRGYLQGRPYEQTMFMNLPTYQSANVSVNSVWARAKIDSLMARDWHGMQTGQPDPSLKKAITETALKHHIVTPFTSFVVIDHNSFKAGQKPGEVIPTRLYNGGPDSVNETYYGLHKWFKDDLVGNLFTNVGQLIGKWLSEITNGCVAISVQFLASGLCFAGLTLASAFNEANRQSSIVVWILAFLLFLICTFRSRSDNRSRRARLPRLTLTTGLLIGYVLLWNFEQIIANDGMSQMSLCDEHEIMMLPYALAATIKGSVIAAGSGVLTVFASIPGNFSLGTCAPAVGSLIYFAALIALCFLGVLLIVELIWVLALHGLQIGLLTGQLLMAPIFCLFFLRAETESLAKDFVKVAFEAGIWSAAWAGLLKAVAFTTFSSLPPCGKLLVVAVLLCMMIHVPGFVAKFHLSPLSTLILCTRLSNRVKCVVNPGQALRLGFMRLLGMRSPCEDTSRICL